MDRVIIDCTTFDRVVAGAPELKARNGHLVVAFDAAALETIEKRFWLPSNYNAGADVTATVVMAATSATSGNVRVRLEFERDALGAQDMDADSFAGADEANAAADATSGETFASTHALSNADLDGAAAGDQMRVRISRVGTDGTNDTMTGDAEFIALILTQ
jgi:hypothetical protein